MGKALIFIGADWSENAIIGPGPGPEPPGPEPPGPDPSANIVFADAAVKAICADNWGFGGEITYGQAAEVTSFAKKFSRNANITSFDEMQYFTGITTFDSQEFGVCTLLESVVLPPNLVSIGGNSFASCPALASLGTAPNLQYLQTIGENVFWGCPITGEITLPAIVSIGNNVFRGTHITKIDLGANLASIGNFAFSGTGAVVVILRAATPPTISASNVFDNTATFYVPYSADHSILTEYKAATGWSGHSARIYELTEDGNIPV